MSKWIEIAPDYRCNNRCVGCFSVLDHGPSMDAREIMAALSNGRKQGADSLWLGGGDPTLRKDLFAIAAAARKLGYARIKLQTNGMMLAYPEYTRRCAAAGITEVAFSIKGSTAEIHDALANTPGCHELMVRGMAEARAAGLSLEGDILVYRTNAADIPAMVRAYTAMGVGCYRIWMFSSTDQGAVSLTGMVARIADVMPHITAAMDLGLSDRADFITSLHTPPCTIPVAYERCRFHAAELDLLVVNPGGHSFRLEESPIEGGTYLDGCGTCAARPHCGGIRADYRAVHGDGEFRPLG